MAFLQIQFFSDVLNVASTVNVILPEANQGIGIDAAGKDSKKDNLPDVLYLLHGYSDDHSIWMRRTSVERYAAEHNLAVIMPAVNHSFYCNELYGERYWDYVSQELPETLQKFLRISRDPGNTYVAGLSMGGYGAMRLALTFPERFAAAASFSGAVDVYRTMRNHDQEGTARRILGSTGPEADPRGTELDLNYLMEQNKSCAHKPRLYVSCGTEDFLYHQHEAFVPALIKAGWNVTRHDEPGAIHEWSFWDQEIKKFIDFIYKDA